MAEATATVSEPRYWKITVNPEECLSGAWGVSLATGLALLGLPGEAGETHYAVKNLKQIREGDWLVAYTSQEGAYTVGGVGRVTRGYRCEEGPFDHPWNGPVRRSIGVEWHPGPCRIEDLVKDGRFRKGKISRLLDEILPEEFACVQERVLYAAAPMTMLLPVEALADTLAAPPEVEVAPPTSTMEASLLELMAPRDSPVVPDPMLEWVAPTVVVPSPANPAMAPAVMPSPVVLDPTAEPPPLPQFFLDRALTEPAPIFAMDEPIRPMSRPAPEAVAPRRRSPKATLPPKNLAEAAASLRRSHEAHLLASFGIPQHSQEVLDFGLPTVGDEELIEETFQFEDEPFTANGAEPFEVRVGTLGWTGVFRREVESGRPCSLLLRGPQYSFLNMAPAGAPLRGLPLFALFAIGAVAAPGKEALRSGATFIFQGRRASGDYAVEVRPRQRRGAFRAPAEANS